MPGPPETANPRADADSFRITGLFVDTDGHARRAYGVADGQDVVMVIRPDGYVGLAADCGAETSPASAVPGRDLRLLTQLSIMRGPGYAPGPTGQAAGLAMPSNNSRSNAPTTWPVLNP